MTTLLLNNLLMINLRVSGINKKNPSASEMKPGIIKKKAAKLYSQRITAST